MGTPAVISQLAFRARNDDGNEATATWLAALNANWTQAVDSTFRVRFVVGVTANFTALLHQLQYNIGGAGWVNITTSSSIVKAVTSTNVADGTATTQQVGTGTFDAGEVCNDGQTASNTILNGSETENEFILQIVGADVAHGNTIQLRGVTSIGGLFNNYTQTPTITVSKPVPPAASKRNLGLGLAIGHGVSLLFFLGLLLTHIPPALARASLARAFCEPL